MTRTPTEESEVPLEQVTGGWASGAWKVVEKCSCSSCQKALTLAPSLDEEDEEEEEEEEEEYECGVCGFTAEAPAPEHCCNCGCYDCECGCAECGNSQSDCACCGDCENYPCTCDNYCSNCDDYHQDSFDCSAGSSSQGNDNVPPWTKRGQKITGQSVVLKDSDWPEHWKIDSDHIDPVQTAADHYLLEALEYGLVNNTEEIRDETILAILKSEAKEAHDELIAAVDPSFRQYVDMAVGGELRHHRAIGGSVLNAKNRSKAWVGWKQIRFELGPQALLDAAALFEDGGWSSSYGGKKWAIPCRLLYRRETRAISPRTFVDQVISIQHNGGSLLDKIGWATKNPLYWGIEKIATKIGPAHSQIERDEDGVETLLPAPRWDVLLQVASPRVYGMWAEWWRTTNSLKWRYGQRPTPDPFAGHIRRRQMA